MADTPRFSRPPAVILAGGLSRRMASLASGSAPDKGLIMLGGQAILSHVIDRLRPQVDALVLNANGDASRFAHLGINVIADSLPGHPGPLAGVLAGMDWAADQGAETILTVPGDTPFLPDDLAARLAAAGAPAMAATDDQLGRARQPTCALWPVDLREDLRGALMEGVRKVGQWADRHSPSQVAWELPTTGANPFFNINTPEDLERARACLKG